MKVSELIKKLQELQKENGDLDCYYAKDEEGNGYEPLYFDPSVMFKLDGDEDNELLSEDDLDEMGNNDDDDNENWLYDAVICVN